MTREASGSRTPAALLPNAAEPENLRTTCEIEPNPAPPRPRLHALHVLGEDCAGRFFVIPEGQELVAGRQSGLDVHISRLGVSRVHAAFALENGIASVRDAGSRNGTYVNGSRISDTTPLAPGDLVTLGPVQLRYALEYDEELTRLDELRNAALRDRLTGTFNRRHLEACLLSEVALASHDRTPLSLLLFDLDFFKRVNDRHGHLAGDAVLRVFSCILVKSVRPEDIVSRWGGEEFAVLAHGIAGPKALLLAEQIREVVANLCMPFNGLTFRFTTSAGVACMDGDDLALGPDELLRRADAALYEAKRRGRNRVVDHRELATSGASARSLRHRETPSSEAAGHRHMEQLGIVELLGDGAVGLSTRGTEPPAGSRADSRRPRAAATAFVLPRTR